jgi:putative transcriptional regulator
MERPNEQGQSGRHASSLGSAFLDGQLLIAMPGIGDPRFERAVIYMCAHSPEGAMGIRINQIAPQITFAEILGQLDIEPAPGSFGHNMIVHRGGPVDSSRGFVLHTADYVIDNATLVIEDGLCLTATLDILRAIVSGRGPRDCLLALGYAGWMPGQLEKELSGNGWLVAPAPADIVFDPEIDGKYERALAQIGVDPRMLSGEAGHA